MATLPAQITSYAGPITPRPVTAGHTLDYVGPTGTLFGIFYKNLILTLITLGIYRFWAKTRERRFIWGNTRIDGEPFDYIGTGKELFLGFLKAVVILVPLFVALQLVEIFILDESLIGIAVLVVVRAVLIVGLVYAGTFAARRYRMSRTTWRGVRFQQNGSMWRYAGMALLGMLLTVLTLGLYLPFLQARLMRYELANLKFGSASFCFDGTGKELFQQFLKVWIIPVTLCVIAAIDIFIGRMTSNFSFVQLIPLLMVLVIGLCALWYQAKVYRFQAQHTALEDLRFAMPYLTGWGLFKLMVGNYFIIVLSLGILFPLTIQRNTRFWVGHLLLSGTIDLDRILQAERGPGTGEGLAGFFDIDVG
jgi:uncharacterized membrane protein YjgN (DUF898 family)